MADGPVIARARQRRVEHWIAHAQSLALARSGRLQAARRSSNRALELALQEGQRETAAIYQAARATWEALCGNAGEGTRTAMAALERSNGRDVEYAAALALGLSLGSSRSGRSPAICNSAFEDTLVAFTYVPVLSRVGRTEARQAGNSVERGSPIRYSGQQTASTSTLLGRSALGLRARRFLMAAAVCRSGGLPEGLDSSRHRRQPIPSGAGTTGTRGCSSSGIYRPDCLRHSWHCGKMLTPISGAERPKLSTRGAAPTTISHLTIRFHSYSWCGRHRLSHGASRKHRSERSHAGGCICFPYHTLNPVIAAADSLRPGLVCLCRCARLLVSSLTYVRPAYPRPGSDPAEFFFA